MQIKSITVEELTKIGNAIRAKTGEPDLITLEDMPTKIRSIGGGNSPEACSVLMIDNESLLTEGVFLTYIAFENGTLTTKTMDYPFIWNVSYGAQVCSIENVLKNSCIILFSSTYQLDFTGENAEAQLASEALADMGYLLYSIKILGDATVSVSWSN